MYFRMIKLIFLFAGIVAFIVGSVYFGYLVFKPGNDPDIENIVVTEENPEPQEEIAAVSPEPADETELERISRETRIMYEYLTPDEEVTDVKEVTMPYYFLGMSEADLTDALIEGWRIKQFDKDMVVLNRTVEESAQDEYLLGVHNGYIAVYYNENARSGSIKETIDKPISALSIDEQNRLINGIPISGEEQLAKILEDYGS